MTEEPVTHRGAVYPWHCDHVGHMNVTFYVAKFDEATWSLFSMLGITRTFLLEAARGMAAVQQNFTYSRELLAGDVVTIRSRILEMRPKVIRFRHTMINDETGEVAAVAEMTGVHLDAKARKSCPFPEDILARGREMMEGHGGHE